MPVGVTSAAVSNSLRNQMKRDAKQALAKLEPRVLMGAGHFKRSIYYKGENLGEVTEILVGWPADREGAALTVVGNRGAHFLDDSGLLKKQIHF
jgi:hypothetical protein